MGEIADDAVEGFACSWCGIYFEEPHQYPVICQKCYKDWKQEAKGNKQQLLREYGLQVAIIDELG